MTKLGSLGLGIMCAPMARQLFQAGHEVALWSNASANAGELAVPTPLIGMSADLLESAIAEDYGEQDICGPIQVLERTAHVEVTPSPPHLVRSG